MRRGRRIALAVVAATFLLAGAAVAYLLYSERGLQWAATAATRYVPGSLSLGQIEGRLAGPIRIRNLDYRTQDSVTTVERLSLDWSPWRLLDAEFHIDRLQAHGVHLIAPPPVAEDAQPPDDRPRGFDLTLPLAIVVEEAEVNEIRVQRGADGPMHPIDRIALNGRLGNRIELGSLQVDAPTGQLRARGWIGARAPHPMALHLDWSLAPAKGPALRGTGAVNGNLQRLELTHTIAGAAEAELNAELNNLLAGPSWQAELQIARLSPDALVETWPQLPISGRIRGGGGVDVFEISGQVHVSESPLGAVDSRLELRHADGIWRLQRATVQPTGTPTRLHASGTLQLDGAPSLELSGNWEDLRWPLRASDSGDEPRFASPEGELILTGWLGDYRLRTRAELVRAETGLGSWQVDGSGDREHLDLAQIGAQTLGGELSGSGKIQWRPELEWNIELTGEGLDPSQLESGWPGELELAVQHSGSLREGVLSTHSRLQRLAGDLRGHPLQGMAQVRTEGARVSVEQVQLSQGPNRLSAQGEISESWDLGWELNAPTLNAAHPLAAGSLDAQGRLSGPRRTPDVEATLNGRKLSYADYAAAGLDVRLALRRQPDAESSLAIEADSIVALGRELGQLRMNGGGRFDRHRLEATWRLPQGETRLTAQGGVEESAWRGQLSTLELRQPELGVWRLQAATDLSLAPDGVSLDQGCLTSMNGRVCLAGSWSPSKGTAVNAQVEELALSLFAGALPESMRLPGIVEGTAEFHDTPERRELSAAFSLPASQLIYAPEGDSPQAFEYRAGQLRLRTENKGLHGDISLPLERLGSLQGNFALPRFWSEPLTREAQTLQAEIEAELHDLSLVAALVPELERTAGSITLQASASGSLAAPELDGELLLRNGRARIPQLGIELSRTRLSVRAAPGGALRVEGEATSEKGQLALTGRIGLDVLRGGQAQLRLTGQEFEVVDLPEAHVFASPKLDIGITGQEVRVTGEVRIPRAEIRAGQYRAPVPVSGDVVLADAPQAPEEPEVPTWRISTRVTVVLGEQVRFEGFGLTARIAGSLTAIDQPGKGTIGEGELRVVEGQYKIYGRELQIEQGRLSFAGGSITNPGIDARAVRKVQEVRAGVRVYGDLQDPRVSLFSDPPMDDSDILSYIVVGRPLNAASQAEGEALYQAARQLGLAGGGLLARRLEETFGFDELSIQPLTDTSEDPALVVGKYLSPRLYVSYAIGLFQDANILQLQYRIDKNWRLQTETGPRAGGDIIYSIER